MPVKEELWSTQNRRWAKLKDKGGPCCTGGPIMLGSTLLAWLSRLLWECWQHRCGVWMVLAVCMVLAVRSRMYGGPGAHVLVVLVGGFAHVVHAHEVRVWNLEGEEIQAYRDVTSRDMR